MSAARKSAPLPILTRSSSWSTERIAALTTPEVRALLGNAQRLGEEDIAALCTGVLAARPRGLPPATPRVRAKRKPREED
jgi:hypothetical protein